MAFRVGRRGATSKQLARPYGFPTESSDSTDGRLLHEP